MASSDTQGNTSFWGSVLPPDRFRLNPPYPLTNKVRETMAEANRAERPTDVALMLRVRDGEECAFEELYRRYHRRLLNFFYGMSRNPHAAADLCQDTFLRIWRIRRNYAATGSFPAFLFTIARFIWMERRREFMKRRWMETTGEPDERWDLSPAAGVSRPDEEAFHAEVRERILDAVEQLPEEQRMAFMMRTVEGLSIGETAAAMQCPANTVRSRKILAIRKLRELLRGAFIL